MYSRQIFLEENSLIHYLKYFTTYSARFFFLKHTPRHSTFPASPFSVQVFRNSLCYCTCEISKRSYPRDLSCSILSLLKYENSFCRSYFCFKKTEQHSFLSMRATKIPLSNPSFLMQIFTLMFNYVANYIVQLLHQIEVIHKVHSLRRGYRGYCT